MFILESCLEEADNSALCFAGPDKKDIGLTALRCGILKSVYKELVGRNDRDTAPCKEVAACDIDYYGWNTASCTFSLKCRYRTGMGKEERRLLPSGVGAPFKVWILCESATFLRRP